MKKDPEVLQITGYQGRRVFVMTIGNTYYQRTSMSDIVQIMRDRRDDYEPLDDAWYGEGRYMGD